MPNLFQLIAGWRSETGDISRRRREVWKLLSRERKQSLVAAAIVAVCVALTGSAAAFFIGGLVDSVQGIVPGDRISALPLRLSHAEPSIQTARRDAGVDAPPPAVDSQRPPPVKPVRLPASLMRQIAWVYLSIIAAAFVLRELLRVWQKYLVENSCTQIEKEMTVRVVSHLLKIDLATLSQERIGGLHGRILRSVEGFVKFVKINFLEILTAVFSASIALASAVFKQPWVGLMMLGVIPVSLLITARQLMSQRGIRVQLMRSKEAMDATVVEQLGGIEYLRAANTHDLEAARVGAAAEQRRVKALRHHMAMGKFDCAKALNEGLFHLLVIALAIYLAATDRVTLGAIVTFPMLFANVMAPLRDVHRIIDEMHDSSIQTGDLINLLNEPIDYSFQLPTVRRPDISPAAPVIVAENLLVEYRTRDGRRKRALDGVSMVIRHGETIGAAGRSGSGKSTWLKGVMRLLHPVGGKLILGGEPIEAISREVIAGTIGYVSQTPFIFAGTIAENIAYGTPNAAPDAVRRAAEMAYIHDEIMAMPGGYEAAVNERGQNLSGGQRQRIALARVFLKNPPILILDEGTSALDNIAERAVQQSINAARVDRTVIMVAHRLSTLRGADRIFVFDGGKIVETGSYDELLQLNGVFAELVRSAGDGEA